MRYLTKPDVGLMADTCFGNKIVSTPWGEARTQAGDVVVPYGIRSVVIPGDLIRQWFTPLDAAREQPFVMPKEGLSHMHEWTRRDLEMYARKVLGVEPPDFPRTSSLLEWVRKEHLRQQAREGVVETAV